MFVIPQSAIRNPQWGGVLLLVMWLTAALSLVALSIALAVRTELEATRYRVEAEQARFLARGAIEQASYVLNRPGLRDAADRPLYDPGRPHMDFAYATGTARVWVLPESGKLSVNTIAPERLDLLLEAAGVEQPRAAEITDAIVDWRGAAGSTVDSPFDIYYSGLPRPYRAAHRPFERLEDLLLVRGVTAELYYGVLEVGPDGRVVRRGGLNRLLTVYGGSGAVNVNLAPYEVLLTVPGMNPESAAALIAGRRAGPYQLPSDLPSALALQSLPYLILASGSEAYSLLATGAPRGSATRASVRALFRRDPLTGETKLVEWEEPAGIADCGLGIADCGSEQQSQPGRRT